MIILIKLMNFNQRVNFTKSNTEFKCYLQTTSPVKITTLTVYSQRVHQCGRRCFVLKHQHGRRYVMWNALLVQVPLYWTFHNELACHPSGSGNTLSQLLTLVEIWLYLPSYPIALTIYAKDNGALGDNFHSKTFPCKQLYKPCVSIQTLQT